MTNIMANSQESKKRRSHVQAFLCTLMCVTTSILPSDAIAMNQSEELGYLVQRFTSSKGLTLEKIQSTLGRALVLNGTDSDEYSQVFQASNVETEKGLLLEKIEFRQPGPKSKSTGFLIIEISGSCHSKSSIENLYQPLQLIQVPRGHSNHEQIAYKHEFTWGELSFGFSPSEPHCLVSISLSPADLDR